MTSAKIAELVAEGDQCQNRSRVTRVHALRQVVPLPEDFEGVAPLPAFTDSTRFVSLFPCLQARRTMHARIVYDIGPATEPVPAVLYRQYCTLSLRRASSACSRDD